jgi:hypothetical protein
MTTDFQMVTLLFYFVVGMEPKISSILGKVKTTELLPQSKFHWF